MDTPVLPAGMPVGRRTPRGSKRWYLVHAPGREQATCDKLRKIIPADLLDDAFVLKRERWRRHAGEWTCHSVPMYQDYLVVATKDVAALDAELAKLSFPARIAKGESRHFAPMAAEAQDWYQGMMDASHTIRTSTGVIVDGKLDVQQGPLVGREAHVQKVLRQKRMCVVNVGDGGARGFSELVPLVVPFKS